MNGVHNHELRTWAGNGIDELMDSLATEFARQALNPSQHEPAGKDPRYQAACQGWMNELNLGPATVTYESFARKLFDRQLRNHNKELLTSDIRPANEVNRAIRAVQATILFRGEADYPQEYTDPVLWQKSIRQVVEYDPSQPDTKLFHNAIVNRDTQSNIERRAKATKLGMFALSRVIGENTSILDLGTSQMKGLKKLKLNSPFEPIEVLSKASRRFTKKPDIVSPGLTEWANELLAINIEYGDCIGVDYWLMNDEEVKFWAKACSFYPSELLNEHLVESYDMLEAPVPGVTFARADITDAVKLDCALDPYQEFGVANISTVLNQLGPQQQQKAIDNALTYSDVCLISDFMHIDKTNPVGIHFNESWQQDPFVTAAIVKGQEHKGLQKLFTWENGRCQRMRPNFGNPAVKRLFEIS